MTTVDHTCPCIRCGYDLQGFGRDDRCPECGTRVHASHHGPPLERADPHWARRIRAGQRQIAWASSLLTLGALLSLAGVLVFSLNLFIDWRTPLRVAGFTVGPLIVVGFTLLISGGVRVTAREPTTFPEMPERRACRGFLYAILAMAALLAPIPLYFALVGPLPEALRWAADGVLLGLVGCAIMLAFYASRYLSRLAVRVPSAPLSRRVRTSAIALVVTSALVVAGVLPSYVRTPRWSQEPDRYYIIAFALLVALALGAAVRFSVVMHQLAGAVARASGSDDRPVPSSR